MAIIYRPNVQQAPQARSQISTSVAAASGQGLVNMGAQMISVGHQFQRSNALSLAKQVSAMVDAQGEQMFRESERAHQSAQLLNKTVEAQEAFTVRATDRYRRETDDDGNPTFQNLHTDIGNIGEEIRKDIGSRIIDPKVRAQFNERFGSYVANQKVSALKRGLNQQLVFGLKSLDNGLGKLIQSAAADDIDQLGGYEQQGLDSIKKAFQGGLVSYEDMRKQSQDFSTTIREAALQNGINSNRARTKEMLSLPAEELGVPEEKRQQLIETLDAAERTDAAEVERAKARLETDKAVQETGIIEDLESRLEAGALREDDLLKHKNSIPAPKFSEMKKKYIKMAEKRQNLVRKNMELYNRIKEGQDISDVKPSDINNLYKYAVELQADANQGQPVTLQQEAKIAAGIPAPVSSFAKKLENVAKYGKLEQAGDALAAYTYIKDRNKPALDSSFDRESTMLMEHVETLVERGQLDPKEAMEKARLKIQDTDSATYQALRKNFHKVNEFKANKIEETAADTLDAENFFGRNYKVDRDTLDTFRQLAQDAYASTGDAESAKGYAKAIMSRTHGTSRVGNEPVYMFRPPEKEHPEFSAEQLRDILVTENTPNLPEGVSPDSIGIASDDATAGQFADGERVSSWIVTYEQTYPDGSKQRLPLQNKETKEVVRWTPKGTTVLQDKAQQKFDEARAQLPGQGQPAAPQTISTDDPFLEEGEEAQIEEVEQGQIDSAVQEAKGQLQQRQIEKAPKGSKHFAASLEAAAAKPPAISQSSRQFKHGRSHTKPVTEIIFHHTAGGSTKSAENALKQRGLSYHYIISKDGKITQLVDPNKRAWHAKGHSNGTLGISFVGGGKHGDATAEQHRAAASLTKELQRQFPTLKSIAGHRHRSKSGKPDPQGFDFKSFSKAVKLDFDEEH